MEWTDKIKAELRVLWDEGHSTAEIGRRLGGVTKSTIVGKAHRMKLPRRISPIRIDGVAAVYIGKWITPERVAVLQRDWPTLCPRAHILDEMSALPGFPIPKPETVSQYARQTLGLKRPTGFMAASRTTAPRRPPVPRSGPVTKPVMMPRSEETRARISETKRRNHAVVIGTEKAPPLKEVFVRRPDGKARSPVFTTGVINWSVIDATKIVHKPGRCRWALLCNNKATGAFCDHHLGLLLEMRRAA